MKHQFYLVENPKETDFAEQYILHAKAPRFIAQILQFQEEFDIATAEYEGPNITFFYINPDGIRETHTLVASQLIDPATPEQIEGKLKRMADWWVDYLMWEDRQTSGRGGKRENLADYNEQTPGLKILYNDFKWAIIYHGIVKVFEAEPEMDIYLTTKLNFTDEQLQKGTINRY